MYKQGIVVAIKVNGSALREVGELTYLPFGSEYSVFINNLNNRRAQVSVFIDGQDQLDGDTLVLAPYQSIDLKRSIKKGNLNQGNAFKFIERSAAIENHRGIKAEDSIVRVSVQMEKIERVTYPTVTRGMSIPSITGAAVSKSAYASNDFGTYATTQVNTLSASVVQPQSATGITVPGSVVEQQFRTAESFDVELSRIELAIKMVGEIEARPVQKALYTSSKLTCSSCGTVSPSTAKFCGECGTSLIVL